MSSALAGWLQVGLLVAALAVCYRPLGDHMARVFTGTNDLRVERVVYRLVGVDADAEQRWAVYLRSMLAFSLVSVLVLYAWQRLQNHVWLALGLPAVKPALAWNTAASFVSNTNWQNYSGESTMGHLVQMAGLAVQNFASAAVGIAVAIALVRGFARSRTDRVGNFWVDLIRCCVRILLRDCRFVGGRDFVCEGLSQACASPTSWNERSPGCGRRCALATSSARPRVC